MGAVIRSTAAVSRTRGPRRARRFHDAEQILPGMPVGPLADLATQNIGREYDAIGQAIQSQRNAPENVTRPEAGKSLAAEGQSQSFHLRRQWRLALPLLLTQLSLVLAPDSRHQVENPNEKGEQFLSSPRAKPELSLRNQADVPAFHHDV